MREGPSMKKAENALAKPKDPGRYLGLVSCLSQESCVMGNLKKMPLSSVLLSSVSVIYQIQILASFILTGMLFF